MVPQLLLNKYTFFCGGKLCKPKREGKDFTNVRFISAVF